MRAERSAVRLRQTGSGPEWSYSGRRRPRGLAFEFAFGLRLTADLPRAPDALSPLALAVCRLAVALNDYLTQSSLYQW
jgi:hypothetical protein